MTEFYNDYYEKYSRLIYTDEVVPLLKSFQELAQGVKGKGKIIFAGNGASASIASHGAVDFTKQAGIRGITFNEANLITCLSNDFGYENWMAEGINFYANKSDIVVLISVSGESLSVVNAAKKAKELGLKVVTFSGRDEFNSLKVLGDINFWVESHAYNIVECIHMIWLTSVIDAVIGKAEYEVS
jgi:D-sedoheptulose 7-phosphate isomerase